VVIVGVAACVGGGGGVVVDPAPPHPVTSDADKDAAHKKQDMNEFDITF
jgi:hypothetical protein